MKQKVLRLSRNEQGRDFVVGDIHFKTIDLFKGLQTLGFDPSIDRVIAVGDLIDRGPGVLDGLNLLNERWFFTVRGNHEQMLIDAHRSNPNVAYEAHGASWWIAVPDDLKELVIKKLECLPVIIEVESLNGIVGIVHGDVPSSMTWRDFVVGISHAKIEEVALWGRRRVVKKNHEGIKGVWRVCAGHTWVSTPQRFGNFIALDCTGGEEGALALYCIQNDVIYIEGRSVLVDIAEAVSKKKS